MLYIATDGAATANGKPNCKCSWSFICGELTPANVELCEKLRGCMLTPKKLDDFISGQASDIKFVASGCVAGDKQSNNIGELTAIVECLKYISATADLPSEILIIVDSEYAFKSIDIWSRGAKKERKNAELIDSGRGLLDECRKKYKIDFIHVRSHKKPDGEIFYWLLNYFADRAAQKMLT